MPIWCWSIYRFTCSVISPRLKFSPVAQQRRQPYLSGGAMWKKLPDFCLFFPIFPLFSQFFLIFSKFLANFCCQGWHSAPPSCHPSGYATAVAMVGWMKDLYACKLQIPRLSKAHPHRGMHSSTVELWVRTLCGLRFVSLSKALYVNLLLSTQVNLWVLA